MHTLKLIGTRPSGHPFPVVSYFIRFFEWSKVSHVALLVSGQHKVAHAHFNEIKYEDLDVFMETNKVVYDKIIRLTDDEYRAVLAEIKRLEGKQKGYWATLFGVLPSLLVRLITFGAVRLGHPCFVGLTCSELFVHLMNLSERTSSHKDPRIKEGTTTTRDALALAKRIG